MTLTSKEHAIKKLRRLHDQVDQAANAGKASPESQIWFGSVVENLNEIFGNPNSFVQTLSNYIRISQLPLDQVEEFERVIASPEFFRKVDSRFFYNIATTIRLAIEELDEFWDEKYSRKASQGTNASQQNAVEKILKILDRFHVVARQLQNRHSNRETITINDEYDVQNLLHALLKIDFDDIRAEEHTPSYASGSSRMDFLIKPSSIVIETKKTRNSLTAKEVGDELAIDIARYRNHPDCKILICFVYDPEARIGNPVGLTKDVQGLSTTELEVVVRIIPI
jgi:uncharacterized protein YoaH (UPF0181 family)